MYNYQIVYNYRTHLYEVVIDKEVVYTSDSYDDCLFVIDNFNN